MDYTSSSFVEFLLSNPHRMESRKRRMDRATKPGRVLAFVIDDNFAAVVMRGQLVHFTPEAYTNILEEGIAASKNDVFEEVTPDRLITLHYRIVNVLLDAFSVDVVSLGQSRIE